MTEKLEHALNGLALSIDNFEKKFVQAQKQQVANSNKAQQQQEFDQNDLFSLSQPESQKAVEVLDRAINSMEKLAKGSV